MKWPSKLSVSDVVAAPRPLDEFLEAATEAGVTGIGLHINRVEAFGFEKVRDLIRSSGLAVVSYSAVGHWASGVDYLGLPKTISDTIRNFDQALELGTDIVCVNGGMLAASDKKLAAARARVVAGIGELIPHAKERNLRLAIEPVHPIFGSNGLPIPTLRYALDIIDELGGDPCLGVLLDTYHVWWEPQLAEQLQRAGSRVFQVQISDWAPELAAGNPDSRALLGEGCIDFDVFFDNLPAFDGWYDTEVVNRDRFSNVPLPELLERIARTSYETLGARLS